MDQSNAGSLGQSTLEEMRRVMLVEIQVSKEDLNLMSPAEIKSIYQEYQKEKAERAQHPNSADNDTNEKDDNTGHSSPKTRQQAPEVSPKELRFQVVVEGEKYYRPKTLDSQAYSRGNRRLAIICYPEPLKVSEKREKLYAAYSASMQSTLRAMSLSEIHDTYKGIKLMHKREYYRCPNFIKNTQHIQQKQAVVLVKLLQVDKNATILDTKALVNNNLVENGPIDQFFDEQVGQVQPPNHNRVPQVHIDKDRKQSTPAKQKLTVKPAQQIKKPLENKASPPKQAPTSLRQSFNNAKTKQKKESSCQTQELDRPVPKQPKPRTKITVVRQVEFVQDQNEPFTGPRTRPLPEQDQDIALPAKINNNCIEQALASPGEQPDPSVLTWISNIKTLVHNLEKQYMNQFSSSWTLVE